MQKSEKEAVVADLAGKFAKTKAAIVAEFNKLDVATVTALRKKLRDGGIEYKVIKNTLAKRAAKGTSLEKVSEDFYGPVALIMSYGDVIAPAKILTEFLKDKETIKVRSAVVEGQKTDAKGITALAKMPGLPELRAKILGCINQPATKVARILGTPGQQLAVVIKAHAEKAQ